MGSVVRSSEVRATLVVVTPARNEAPNIFDLVGSVTRQTRLPDRWIIVDDASTDGTWDLATKLCSDLSFASVIRLETDSERSFAAKVGAVDIGVQAGVTDDTQVLVNLDADAILPPDYFAAVMKAFEDEPKLGVFGGVVGWSTNGSEIHAIYGPSYHVPGPGQAIRMEAWNDVDGYWPLRFGGEDVAIYVAASMHGWTSRSDSNLLIELSRPTGSGGHQGSVRSMYERGMQDYDLGRSFWYESLKLTRWLLEAPIVLGATARACGFVMAAGRTVTGGRDRMVSQEFVRHVRHREREQVRSSVMSLRARWRR